MGLTRSQMPRAARIGVGPLPSEGRRASTPSSGWIAVPHKPFEDGRKRELPPDQDWPIQTHRWWNTLRVMPHACLWDESDWEFAIATAFISREFYYGKTGLATELRIRERSLGVTEEARRAQRIRYVEPTDNVPAEVLSINRAVPVEERPPLKGQTKSRLRAIDPEARR